MRLQDRPPLNEAKEMWQKIDHIKAVLGLEDLDISSVMEITPKKFQRLREKLTVPKITELARFLDSLDVDFDVFVSGNLDCMALAKRLKGECEVLPERYSRAAFSKRRSSVEALTYLTSQYGIDFSARILKKLQVDWSVFSNLDGGISTLFLVDLASHLKRMGIRDEAFFKMGLMANEVNKKSSAADHLRHHKSHLEFYRDLIIGPKPLYDFNYDYRFQKLDEDGCILDCFSREEALNALGSKKIGDSALCLNRLGRVSSAVGIAGFKNSQVKETKCVHRGDTFCRIEVVYVKG